VVSGVAVLDCRQGPAGIMQSFADRAWVVFGSIDRDEIKAYAATDQWRGKAGGYNLFDRQAASWPITVEGDPTTVVGLPMKRLSGMLGTLGVISNQSTI
jgi:septum formation protein